MKHNPERLFENYSLCIYNSRNYYGNFRLQSVAHKTVSRFAGDHHLGFLRT